MEMENKTKGELLREELFYTKKSVFEVRTLAELDEAREYAKGYAEYLDNSKTEREAVITTIKMLKERGYTEYSLGDKVVPGGKYYLNNRGKEIFAFRMGTESLNEGMRISAAHIDSPRLDLKQVPELINHTLDEYLDLILHVIGVLRESFDEAFHHIISDLLKLLR